MGLFVKGESKTKEKQPQYYLSATGSEVYNYNVYYMSFGEKVLYFIIGFIVGAAVGYLFYGGIGKNEYGEPTMTTWICDIVISSIVGIIAGLGFIPIRTEQIKNKKQRDLKLQFRELLDALSTSLGSGKNIPDAFKAAKDDLSIIYSHDTAIIRELDVILDGIVNAIDIELSLRDFGIRSGIADIVSFSDVFETCYRKGGNIKDVIKNTQQILAEKMEIEMEIQTIVTGSRNEQMIMTVMPIGIVGIIKLMSPEFAANFVTPTGIISTTIAVIMFIAAYIVGKIVLSIKI